MAVGVGCSIAVEGPGMYLASSMSMLVFGCSIAVVGHRNESFIYPAPSPCWCLDVLLKRYGPGKHLASSMSMLVSSQTMCPMVTRVAINNIFCHRC